jgi:hypothetical protein
MSGELCTDLYERNFAVSYLRRDMRARRVPFEAVMVDRRWTAPR